MQRKSLLTCKQFRFVDYICGTRWWRTVFVVLLKVTSVNKFGIILRLFGKCTIPCVDFIDDLALRKLSNRAAGGTSFGENSSSGSRTYGREVRTHLLRNLDPVGAGEQIASTRIASLVFLDLNWIFIAISFSLLSVMRRYYSGWIFKTSHNYFLPIFLYLWCAYFAVVTTALFDMGLCTRHGHHFLLRSILLRESYGMGAPSKVISDNDKNYSKHLCKKAIYFGRTKFLLWVRARTSFSGIPRKKSGWVFLTTECESWTSLPAGDR